MPKFSKRSQERLSTCAEPLQRLFNEVIKHRDCTIIEGHRGQERQDRFYDEGKSRVKFPNGKHNEQPSEGIDVGPYFPGIGLSWDHRHCLYFAGFVMGTAEQLGIRIRWGGDWDMGHEPVTDQDFQDLVHFELMEE